MSKPLSFALGVTIGLFAFVAPVAAQEERVCDVAFENCRTPVLDLIRNEKIGIDWSFWITEDARYANEIIKRFKAGVPVRVVMDLRANAGSTTNATILDQLKAAGIPMRDKPSGGVAHMKMMLFAGQNRTEFSGANYNPYEYVPATPWVNYQQESIYFTSDPSIVNSLKTRFDDVWTNGTDYHDYANVRLPRTRVYPTYAISPDLNFPPEDSYVDRLLPLMDAETQTLHVVMFRLTDSRPVDALIRAHQRGVDARMVAESQEYRNPARIDDSYNLDRLYVAGVPIRVRAHAGINHQKSAVFGSQTMAWFGSSNWSTASDDNQLECNYFTTKNWFFTFFEDQFNRMWSNLHQMPDGTFAQETKAFAPLPPDKPVNQAPAKAATGLSTATTLQWSAGPWAWVYDLYLGTVSDPPLYKAGLTLGPSRSATDFKNYAPADLLPGTTYYWKIVSRTMADQKATGPIWSFTTAGTAPPPSEPPPPPPPSSGTIVLWAGNVASTDVHGNWQVIADATAAGGRATRNPDAGKAKIAPALAQPANYFEMTFPADAGRPYHVWLRLRADNDSASNDSVHVQFNDSVACSSTAAQWQIATTSSAEIVLQNGPTGAIGHGWGWSENGWGALGVNVCFAASGPHVVRIQQREDGAIVDQVVLSPDTYLTTAPGVRRDDATILQTTVTTAPPPPPPPPPPSSGNTVVLWAANTAAADVHGNWTTIADTTAAGGRALSNPDAGSAKIAPALASPASYFETTFAAPSATPHHLWLRLRAQNNSTSNDSVHVQFDDTVNCSTNQAMWRIGSTDSAEIVLQDGPSGAIGHSWGWSENGWGALGINVCFASTGTHRVRVQQREDGAIVDQIVLSPDAYLSTSPGVRRDDVTILAATTGTTTTPVATLVRQPFLQQVTSTSALVVWATTELEPATVVVSSNGATVSVTATPTRYASSVTGLASDYYQYVANIGGLAPSTSYSYRLRMNGGDLTDGSDRLITAPATGLGTATFIAFGDSGVGSTEQFALASRMTADRFDFAMHLGDLVYGNSAGTGAATYQGYQSWFFNVYKDWLRTHAVFPVIGNHDNATASAQPYRDVFVLPENGASAAFPDDAERFYSFDYGPAHIIVLDTELAFLDTSRRQAQVDWLTADLQSTTQPWKIVAFHRPPYSSGTEHGSDLTIRSVFTPIFERYGVQLVLNGHDHDYERTVPIQATTDATAHPVTYVVSGGGGAPLYAVGSNTWTAVSQSVHHYLRVTAADCTLSTQAIGLDGSTIDAFTIDRCGP